MFILICIMLCQCNRGIIVKDRMENKGMISVVQLVDNMDMKTKEKKRKIVEYEEKYKLHNAVESNNYKLVEKFLNEGIDIYLQTDSGITAMHIVAELGYHNILELIYKQKQKIIVLIDKNRYSEAHYAAENKNDECIKIIAKYIPKALNDKNKDGNTPLHIAIQKENVIQVSIMTNGDVEVNAQNNKLITPLISATNIINKEKRDRVIGILIGVKDVNLDIQDTNEKTAIEYLYNIDDYRNVNLLLTKGANLNIKDSNKLTLPMKVVNDNNNKNSSASSILQNKNINIEKRFPDGDTLLHKAVKNKNKMFVKYLLEREDISKIISKKENKQFSTKIFGKKIKKLFKGKTALSLAMEDEVNSNIVGLFVEYGINVNKKRGISRRTLLHKSMKENKPKITKELLKSREGRKNLLKRDITFSKPLQLSSLSSEQLIIIAFELNEIKLIKKAIKLNNRAIFGKNILKTIAKSKNKDLMNFLLKEYTKLEEKPKIEIKIKKGEEITIDIEENLENNIENFTILQECFKVGNEIYLENKEVSSDLTWKKGSITINIIEGKIIIKASNDLTKENIKFFFKDTFLFEIEFNLSMNVSEV